MVKEITKYVSEDGAQFGTREEAEHWEEIIVLQELLSCHLEEEKDWNLDEDMLIEIVTWFRKAYHLIPKMSSGLCSVAVDPQDIVMEFGVTCECIDGKNEATMRLSQFANEDWPVCFKCASPYALTAVAAVLVQATRVTK